MTSLLLLLVLLALSGFLSSSETVLFGLTQHELQQCKQSGSSARRLAAELMHRPRSVLLTILIGNTTVNVLIFANSFVIQGRLAEDNRLLAAAWGIMTVALVIVVGEVLAKTMAISLRYSLAPVIAPPIRALQVLFTPLRATFEHGLVTPISRLLIGGGDPKPRRLGVEELQTLVEISRRRGVINPDETDMLQEVVGLAEMRVPTIMVPRVDMVSFDLKGTRDELVALMTERQLTKVPVYEKNIDHLLGVIHVKDLYLSPQAELRDLITSVQFVPEQITVERLLVHFRDTKTQLAIIVDEYGGVSGLATLEDVAEQIVGDISEPGEMEPVQQIDEATFRMAGDVSVEAWEDVIGRAARIPRVTTLGGLIAARLGRPARQDDVVHLGNVRVSVERMHGHRVQWVRVTLDGGQP